jgi:uncharacterized protein YjbJ (UPF0337 family)
VTSPGQAAGAAQQAAGQTASTAKDEAAATASTAASAAADVAGTAAQQAGQVAGEAVDQVRQLADQARAQASEQAGNATQKLSDSVRSLATEVRDLSQGNGDGSGTVAGLAQQLADKGEQLAEYLAQQGPGGLVQELRSFAARRPGTFLLGALAAGVATGRVVKGATAAGSGGPSGAGGQLDVVAVPAPVVTPPVTPPVVADPYPAATPVVRSDDSGILDAPAPVAGPVSGDQRLVDGDFSPTPPYESGTGLR